jgi:hypothetical protein
MNSATRLVVIEKGNGWLLNSMNSIDSSDRTGKKNNSEAVRTAGVDVAVIGFRKVDSGISRFTREVNVAPYD